MKTVYENSIKGIGASVEEFKGESMFITFDENAPDTLKDYCYMISAKEITEEIKVGDTLILDETSYKITALGDVAIKNLASLGHATFVFNGADSAELPGSICVETKEVPTLKLGSVIQIVAA